MNMTADQIRQHSSKRWRRRCLIALGVVVVALIMSCAYFRVSSPSDVSMYIQMSQEGHPIWSDLSLRLIDLGDPAEEVARDWHPTERWDYGSHSTMRYDAEHSRSEIILTSKDGALIWGEALGHTWQWHFFGDPQDDLEAKKAFRKFLEK